MDNGLKTAGAQRGGEQYELGRGDQPKEGGEILGPKETLELAANFLAAADASEHADIKNRIQFIGEALHALNQYELLQSTLQYQAMQAGDETGRLDLDSYRRKLVVSLNNLILRIRENEAEIITSAGGDPFENIRNQIASCWGYYNYGEGPSVPEILLPAALHLLRIDLGNFPKYVKTWIEGSGFDYLMRFNPHVAERLLKEMVSATNGYIVITDEIDSETDQNTTHIYVMGSNIARKMSELAGIEAQNGRNDKAAELVLEAHKFLINNRGNIGISAARAYKEELDSRGETKTPRSHGYYIEDWLNNSQYEAYKLVLETLAKYPQIIAYLPSEFIRSFAGIRSSSTVAEALHCANKMSLRGGLDNADAIYKFVIFISEIATATRSAFYRAYRAPDDVETLVTGLEEVLNAYSRACFLPPILSGDERAIRTLGDGISYTADYAVKAALENRCLTDYQKQRILTAIQLLAVCIRHTCGHEYRMVERAITLLNKLEELTSGAASSPKQKGK